MPWIEQLHRGMGGSQDHKGPSTVRIFIAGALRPQPPKTEASTLYSSLSLYIYKGGEGGGEATLGCRRLWAGEGGGGKVFARVFSNLSGPREKISSTTPPYSGVLVYKPLFKIQNSQILGGKNRYVYSFY